MNFIPSSVFIDIPEIAPHYDIIQLATYDFQTPTRNPQEADFSAPIYDLNDRVPGSNINSQVTYWLSNNVHASKLHICIPTFGRTWQLESESTSTGVPPILEVYFQWYSIWPSVVWWSKFLARRWNTQDRKEFKARSQVVWTGQRSVLNCQIQAMPI